ncbi:MAG: D-sedoheptulose 7-phosphate isomerase [Patescibacteria group bacterium]
MIERSIKESIELKQKLLQASCLTQIQSIGQKIIDALKQGNKLFIAGNGGSAADAQHFAAELAGKFEKEKRKPLPAIALTTNTSNLTAIANDFGFEYVFSRQLESLAREGDIYIAISASGNSPNIVKGLQKAREMNMKTVGLTGNDGGKMNEWCDEILTVPSSSTPRIQECHILIIHLLCEMIDDYFA